MKMLMEHISYYPRVQPTLNKEYLAVTSIAFSKLTYSMRANQMRCTYSVRQTQERLQYLRYKSLGTNKEVTHGRSRFRRTIHTGPRFGPTIRRPVVSNRQFKGPVYGITRVSVKQNICFSQWSISRTARWNRYNNHFNNNFLYLHDAVDGRLTNGDLFTAQQNKLGAY